MLKNGKTGSIGIIPDDEYLRKIETTDIGDIDNNGLSEYEVYLRGQLSDFRPDAPFLESDQTRDPSDRGSGYGSRERLNLRYEGTRSGARPDLPDGTFLDYEFMERDPRGSQNLPDFQAARKQREARGVFLKFSNDDDYSVPETGVNPVQMVSNIRGAQKQFKDRYKNFDDSMGSFAAGTGTNSRGKTSTVALVTTDGTIVNLADSKTIERADPVTQLSNRISGVPRYTEPDHRVKVSKYGLVKPIMSLESNDWNENRRNAYLDHAKPVELNGQLINRTLAHLILDIEGQRLSKQAIAQGAQYGESEELQLRDARRYINPDDLLKLIDLGIASRTSVAPANMLYYDKETDTREVAKSLDIRNMLGQVKINHEQASSMMQVNHMAGPRESKDLRESVDYAGIRYNVLAEQGNKARFNINDKAVDNLVREGLDTRHREESLAVKQYAGLKPLAQRNPHQSIEWDKFGGKSQTLQNIARRNGQAKNTAVDLFENDADMEEFKLPGRKKTRDVKSYGGRMLQADRGDMKTKDSVGSVDIHDMLSNMIKLD